MRDSENTLGFLITQISKNDRADYPYLECHGERSPVPHGVQSEMITFSQRLQE